MTALALVLIWAVGSNAQTIPIDEQPDLLVGTGPGRGLVRLLSGADGSELVSGSPWGAGATSGVRVAAGDVTGDGVADLFVATGPGDGRVSAFDGADASLIVTFAPFGSHFRGGVHLATGDIDGDGRADLLVGGGNGSGRVRIYSSATYQQIVTDFPFGPDYTGGVTVAAGDVNGDGRVDVILGQETGELVRVFDGAGPSVLASGSPYGAGFRGGVYVAAGDVDGDGQAEVITGQRDGGRTVLVIHALTMQPIAGFAPFGSGNGVTVAAGDLNGDGIADLVVGSGPGSTPRVRVFRGPDGLELMSGLAFEADFLGGVFVATTAESAGLRFTSDAAATFEVGTSGSFTISTVGPLAALTMAGTLPAGVTFTDNGDGTASLQGTPAAGTGGTHALTFTATTGSTTAEQDFTLTVNDRPAITSASSATFPLGAPSTFTVTTTGFPAPAITLGGAALPTGVTLTDHGDGTATLAGTPAAGTGGTYALVITAANGVGTDATQAFTLTVDTSPVFSSAPATTFQVGVAGSFAIVAAAIPPVTAIAIGGATLPAGVAFADSGSGTATLSGTPAIGTGGTYALTFTATNGVHAPTVQNFTLTVNEPPAVTSAASATFPLGAPTTFTVTTSGFPAPALTLGGALPAGLTFVDTGNGTGTLSGTATAGGVFALTITAANGVGASAVQNFTLTVDQSPGFTSPPATTFTVGVPGNFAITTVGVPSVNAITLGGVPLPAGVVFTDLGNGTASLAGIPAPGTGGTYAITFTASNGMHAPVVQAFTLTVVEPPAITSAGTGAFIAGAAGSFTVTTTGFPSPSLIAAGTLPAGVTFVDNGNGTATLSGVPAAGSGASYALSITAANGIGSDAVQAFTLNVTEEPAITSANAASFAVGVAGTFSVTTSGFPLPAITLAGALPAGVTFTDNGNGTGTLSGTPAVASGAIYTVTLTADNGVGTAAAQPFTLTVNEALAFTSTAAATFTAGQADTFTVTTVGFPRPTLTISALPGGVTFVDNGDGTGTLSGPAAPGTGGIYALTLTANNGGAPVVQAFTFTVQEALAFTSADAATFTEDLAGTFSVTTVGFPSPTLSVAPAPPAGVTFVDNGNGTATLAGTATVGGTFALTLTADNGVGAPVTQTFTLTITAVNDAPSFTAGPNQNVLEDAGVQTVAGWATAISPGPADEAAQVVAFVVTGNTNPALFSAAPAVSSTGTLTYTSAPNAFGTATITLIIQDNGGTAGGGVDTSAPQMFTIDVTPVNDAPLTVADSFDLLGNTELRVDMPAGATPHTLETTSNPNAVEGILDNDGDPEGDPFAVTAITGCADATAPFDCTLPDGALIHADANGEFSYIPAPGTSTGGFTYTATDTPLVGTAASTNGTVTFTFFDMIWYVDGNVAGPGSGTSADPFNALTAANLNGAGGTGDLDDTDDYILVHDSTITGGIELEANQHLIGEFVGLSINRNLNGNGAPTTVVPPNGARSVINGGAGNAIGIANTIPNEIRGLALSSTAANAIDLTTSAALTGSPTVTIANNQIVSAGTEGIDVNLNAGTAGTLALAISGNTWNPAGVHAGSAVDVARAAGTLQLDLSGNTNILSTGGAGVVVNGGAGGAASTFITGFANNSIHGNTAGGGVTIANATFDAAPGGAADAVNAGVLLIGASGNPVGGAGLVLNPVLGSLAFTDLDVFAGTSGLTANGTGGSLTLATTPGTTTVSAANGAAVDVTTAAIDLQLSSLTSTTSAAGVSLASVTGPFSAPTGSSITKASGGGTAFSVSSSNVTMSYAGSLNVSAGGGVALTGNAAPSTFTFSGGLTLSTGANAGFTATGGGTVVVTDPAGAPNNSIVTTTGTALNVANTTIGAAGLTFQNIAANGAPSGIVLDTTGSSGGLTVTGTGAAGTGGTIQGSTGPGVSLASTGTVNLSYVNIQNGGDDGIRGAGVNGLNLTSVNITANGNAVGERGIDITELTGGGSMASTTVSGSAEHNVRIANTAGTLSTFNVTNSTFSLTNFTTGDDGFLVEQNGTGTMNLSITGSTFTDNKGDHFQVASQASASGSITFTFSNNVLTTTPANDPNVIGGGITISPSGSTDVTFTISNNNIQEAFDEGINLNLGTASTAAASMVGTISGNIVGTAGQMDSGSESGTGINVTSNGAGVTTVSVTGNTVHQFANPYGILLNHKEGSSTMNATVTGNTVANPGTFALNGIRVDSGATASDTGTMCVAITGNNATGSGLMTDDIRLRQRFGTTIRLPGYAGGAADTTAVNSFVSANNDPVGPVAAPTVSSAHNVGGGGGGFVGGAACPTP